MIRKKHLNLPTILWLLVCGLEMASAQSTSLPQSNEGTWLQWRGNSRDGRMSSSHEWPNRLSSDSLTQQWRIPLGPSYSGPIVTESLVFTTETQDKKLEIVRAFDRQNGEQRWEQSWEGQLSVPFFAKSNGDWIRSTPAFVDECLYVGGIRDRLVCLNTATGEIRWQVDFTETLDAPVPEFGMVCSPLIDGDFVYVQAGAGFCKLDKRTGKLIWRTLQDTGGMWGSAFSSPMLATIAGHRQMLVQTREKLTGIDLESGDVLWSKTIPAFRGMNILTPLVSGDSVFTSAYRGSSQLFKIEPAGNQFMAEEAWNNPVKGYMSSPVLIDGNIYLHLQNQRFTCIDLATGKSRWTTRPFGKYWSLVVNGDKIMALDERGELLLIQANPEKFELISRLKISDGPTWAHLAVCGNEIFVRELEALSAYRWAESFDPKSSSDR